jgi:hypothetical protein
VGEEQRPGIVSVDADLLHRYLEKIAGFGIFDPDRPDKRIVLLELGVIAPLSQFLR